METNHFLLKIGLVSSESIQPLKCGYLIDTMLLLLEIISSIDLALNAYVVIATLKELFCVHLDFMLVSQI